MAPPRLVTIKFSHYCEKARWGLDRAGITYVEDAHLPLFAWVPALRAGRRRTVPSLVTDHGAVTDSTDILRWCDARGGAPLFPADLPEVAELEERFDAVLGPHARRLAYGFLLPGLRGRLDGVNDVPRWQITAARATAPAIAAFMRRGLRIDGASMARSQGRIAEVFAEVGHRLADGRRYLAGDRFTAADLTFAALATPVLLPPQLADVIPMDDLPPGLAAIADELRATPAGAFALRLYAEDRGVPGRASGQFRT